MALLVTEKERKLIIGARSEKEGRICEMWDILSQKVYHNIMAVTLTAAMAVSALSLLHHIISLIT